MKELCVPTTLSRKKEAQEILRAWMEDDALHVSLFPSQWNEPGAWGLVLADIVRHLGDAYQKGANADPGQVMLEIIKMFLAEFQEPTGDPTGDFVQ